jgi:hypothetical protein
MWKTAILSLQNQVQLLYCQLASSRSQSMAQQQQIAQLREQLRLFKSGSSTGSGKPQLQKLQTQLLQAKKEARTSKSERDRAMDDQRRLVLEKNQLRRTTEQAQEAYAKLERISTTRLNQTKNARADEKAAVEKLAAVQERLEYLSDENKVLKDKDAKAENETSRQVSNVGSKEKMALLQKLASSEKEAAALLAAENKTLLAQVQRTKMQVSRLERIASTRLVQVKNAGAREKSAKESLAHVHDMLCREQEEKAQSRKEASGGNSRKRKYEDPPGHIHM